MPVIAKPMQSPSGPIRVTMRAGIAVFPDHARDRESLLNLADRARYESKTRKQPTVIAKAMRDATLPVTVADTQTARPIHLRRAPAQFARHVERRTVGGRRPRHATDEEAGDRQTEALSRSLESAARDAAEVPGGYCATVTWNVTVVCVPGARAPAKVHCTGPAPPAVGWALSVQPVSVEGSVPGQAAETKVV